MSVVHSGIPDMAAPWPAATAAASVGQFDDTSPDHSAAPWAAVRDHALRLRMKNSPGPAPIACMPSLNPFAQYLVARA
jgi:hypothetical protein